MLSFRALYNWAFCLGKQAELATGDEAKRFLPSFCSLTYLPDIGWNRQTSIHAVLSFNLVTGVPFGSGEPPWRLKLDLNLVLLLPRHPSFPLLIFDTR